ncbi:hypothetical protein ACH5RR_036451 [Cinchona calisaya]|uniref:Uncharacterized protein n=1 Tax=Cinchona calisaya TaxID=153742 RepID=A0ABD2Y383_9GENT
MVKTSPQSILILVFIAIAIALSFPKMEATRVGRKLLEGGVAGVGADEFVVPCKTDDDCLYAYKIFFGLDKGHCLFEGSAVGHCEPL